MVQSQALFACTRTLFLEMTYVLRGLPEQQENSVDLKPESEKSESEEPDDNEEKASEEENRAFDLLFSDEELKCSPGAHEHTHASDEGELQSK